MQQCRTGDLRCREVVNVADGRRLGFVDDVLLDVHDGRIVALTVRSASSEGRTTTCSRGSR